MTQISFHEVCRLWKQEKKMYVKTSTMAAYSLIIQNHLEPQFKTLNEVTTHSVQKMIDRKLKDGLNVTTIKGMLIVLKMIVKYGEKHGRIEHRIIEVRFPTPRMKPRLYVLTVSEEQRMLKYLTTHPDRYNLGLLICLYTGIRIGEVCSLKWGDVDFDSGTIRVRRTVHRILLLSAKTF